MNHDNRPGFLFVLPWGIKAVGGVNEVVLNLYDEIYKGGKYRPLILVNEWNCVKPVRKLVDNREIIYLRLRSPYSANYTFLRLLIYFLFFPYRAYNLLKIFKLYNVRVVNPHYPELPIFCFCLLRKLKIFKGKFIISIHGTDIRSLEGFAGLRKVLWRSLLKSSHGVVACSQALKNEAISILGLEEKCFFVVHNGVNDSLLKSAIENEDYRFYYQLEGTKYILNVGTFEYKKGQDNLISAFHILSGKFPEFKLVLVGRRTEYLDELIKMSEKLALNDKVIFFTDIPHSYINQFFQFAQFFVLPSRIEPFGIVLLEAGLFKLPVIASKVGGVSEIITDGINGKLVRPGNIDELCEQMEYFCMNGSSVGLLGLNLYENVRKHFSWGQAYRQYMKLFT